MWHILLQWGGEICEDVELYKTSDVFKTSDVYKVQIFDVLGIEIKNLTPALSMNGEGVRIDL